MGDKTTNKLILIILLIVVGLALVFAYKVIMQEEYIPSVIANKTEIDVSEETEQNNNLVQNTNVIENKVENNIVANTVESNAIENNQTIVIPSVNESVSASSQSTYTVVSTYNYNNKYYYYQLDSYAKAIYDAIVDNIGNLKSGDYEISIDYDFSSLLDQSNGQEELNNSYNDAVNAINLDVPNLFYIDFSKMYLNIGTKTTMFGKTYNLYIAAKEGTTYFADGYTSESQVESAIASVDAVKNQVCASCTGTDYSKLKYAHDWLIGYMEYDSSTSNSGDVYGAFVQGKGVCEAYARAYKYILDTLGINNILVTGTATNSNGTTENHMWSYVQLNGTWYAVDVTWDDPIVHGGGTVSDSIKHQYFLIGSSELFENHVEGTTISPTGKRVTLPTLSVENYQ